MAPEVSDLSSSGEALKSLLCAPVPSGSFSSSSLASRMNLERTSKERSISSLKAIVLHEACLGRFVVAVYFPQRHAFGPRFQDEAPTGKKNQAVLSLLQQCLSLWGQMPTSRLCRSSKGCCSSCVFLQELSILSSCDSSGCLTIH